MWLIEVRAVAMQLQVALTTTLAQSEFTESGAIAATVVLLGA